jgi:predicted PurR-regulated permease PerM
MKETAIQSGPRQRLIETALALLLVLLLIAATFRVLLPFLGALTYAVILATATSGLFERLVNVLKGRRKLAAILFGMVAIAITVVPLVYLSFSIADLVQIGVRWLNDARDNGIPDLPEWIRGLPWVGAKAIAAWQSLQHDSVSVLQQYKEEFTVAGRWLLGLSVGVLLAIFELLVGVIVAAMIHASGNRLLLPASQIAEHIAGQAGPGLLDAAGRAIRGVAIGVVGTALLEGVLAWMGFTIAGVPGAIALAAVTFLLAVIQIGPLLVWLPVAIWLITEGQIGWAVFMAIWGVVLLMGADNIVKPILIARSGHLPLLVLFVGVIGGLAAWGFTGMFIGATTLAILWTVLQDWLGTKANGAPSATT